MKNSIPVLVLLFISILAMDQGFSQCTPGNESTCPDPENNGQVCPATMPDAIVDQTYSQEFTIIAPSQYVLDSASGVTIDLHHIKLLNLGNLPPGLNWVSNSPDSIFNVGTYYCVLMDGTPTLKGDFPLKIVIDVWVPGILGSPPIYVGTITDSTSLAISVIDASGISEFSNKDFMVENCAPNPFKEGVTVSFFSRQPETYSIDLFDLVGSKVSSQLYQAHSGKNELYIDGRALQNGTYIYTLMNDRHRYTGRIMKTY
jgi:hypothetical protein